MKVSEAAKRLLEDDTFKLVMRELREELIAGWKSSVPDDVKGREQIYFLIVALATIESRLQSKVDDEKVTQAKDSTRKKTQANE